ncbi:hypothetical protein JCM9492_15790 [Aquifex pyrophilus]
MILLILLPFLLFGSELKICHKAYYLIFPVAYNCTTYRVEREKLTIEANTTNEGLGKLLGKVEIRGVSEGSIRRTKLFKLKLNIRGNVREHFYIFKDNGVYYVIKGKERFKGFMKAPPYDPFRAGLFLYITASERERVIKFFYDGKVQEVKYRVVGRETLEWKGKVYKTLKVLIKPKVETKGLLKPKGEWLLWLDLETLIPVRLKVSFTLGSVNMWIDRVKGDTKLFWDLRQSLGQTPLKALRGPESIASQAYQSSGVR